VSVTGLVKFFNGEKGFGFLKPDTGRRDLGRDKSDIGERDIFLDISEIDQAGIGPVTGGQRLVFDIEDRGKGPRAINVKRPPSDGGTGVAGMAPEVYAAYVAKRVRPNG
jgi:CspA family cold shock protein